jgi:hypothetical protein
MKVSSFQFTPKPHRSITMDLEKNSKGNQYWNNHILSDVLVVHEWSLKSTDTSGIQDREILCAARRLGHYQPRVSTYNRSAKALSYESEINNLNGSYPVRSVPRSTWSSKEDQDFRVPTSIVKLMAPIFSGSYWLRR